MKATVTKKSILKMTEIVTVKTMTAEVTATLSTENTPIVETSLPDPESSLSTDNQLYYL